MKLKPIISVLVFGFTVPAFAAPAIDFTTAGTPGSFNSPAQSSTIVGGIKVDALIYSGGTTYSPSQLWLRIEGQSDSGLGVCSETTACGPAAGPGGGDWNELSNNFADEVIRLTRPDNMKWTDLWVSSLDADGTNGNESGVLYWSNSLTPVLSGGVSFSHSSLGADFGSIWSAVSGSIDANARYLFFRTDPANVNPNTGHGNNDYLVWGANVTAVPEPETYAMLLAGLGLLGFAVRRRKQ